MAVDDDNGGANLMAVEVTVPAIGLVPLKDAFAHQPEESQVLLLFQQLWSHSTLRWRATA